MNLINTDKKLHTKHYIKCPGGYINIKWNSTLTAYEPYISPKPHVFSNISHFLYRNNITVSSDWQMIEMVTITEKKTYEQLTHIDKIYEGMLHLKIFNKITAFIQNKSHEYEKYITDTFAHRSYLWSAKLDTLCGFLYKNNIQHTLCGVFYIPCNESNKTYLAKIKNKYHLTIRKNDSTIWVACCDREKWQEFLHMDAVTLRLSNEIMMWCNVAVYKKEQGGYDVEVT